MVIRSIARDGRLKRLCQRLAENPKLVHASGLWGSSAPMVTAIAAAASPRVYLYVTAHPEQADKARDDLELFSEAPCLLFPAWESLPGEGAAAGEIEAERLRVCAGLQELQRTDLPASSSTLIVAPIQALMQPVPSPDVLDRNTLHLKVDERATARTVDSPEGIVEWAIARGFERLDLVESPGDVAQRGDIVDLFAPGESAPYRIQFFEDRLESIRRFDVSSQRSIESLSSISVACAPRRDAPPKAARTQLFTYVPSDALVVLDRPGEIQEMGEILVKRLGESACPFQVSDVLRAAHPFGQLHLSHFGSASVAGEEVIDFGVVSCSRFEGDSARAVSELCEVANDHDVHVFCDNEGERQRLNEMLAEHPGQAAVSITIAVGVMHAGFEWTGTNTVVIPHHHLFGRQRQRRRIRRVHATSPIDSWLDLAPGDVVVHVVHGIAIYRGLTNMQKRESGQQEEFLSLEFADRAVVHVPTSQVDLVQKYIGAGGRRPPLSKLGGTRWGKTKTRVAGAVAELAESLLRLQAVRSQVPGTRYPRDTTWQREFEASFLYEETEDQLQVAGEIRDDLVRERPMDRLICGDVGYGKTELAMRAAFKVVEYGKQVAMLVPTTVLSEQHYTTFSERMAEYPFNIGCLSRFRAPAEQKRIIDQLRKGQIDIVIGTHRLLSKDVAFADLGLVIIDEEQRFGVAHKESLKAIRETVDVLTLTATPIPRTLHMSLMGIRDISSLQTPPVDRRAITTQVRPFDKGLIRDAILRELNRDGQVYFVHNFVQSIQAMAQTIEQIVPEARVVFGHGQMKAHELERVMQAFLDRKADVLVATTIIESGIDIPRVNTIFINRAERFGLADLHQLRGRVGRSDRRACCFLLLAPERPPTDRAAKRLKTIEEFSELGAGFRIAMRDLEIRGAGNLLGSDQSGQIGAVGYEMYCQLLKQSVRRMRNEPDPIQKPVQIDLDVAAHISPNYIRADRSRLDVYRRIAACRVIGDLRLLEKDLRDAFGPYPSAVQQMLQLTEIRVHARRFGIASISLRRPDVVFLFNDVSAAEPLFQEAPGSVRMPDPRTAHLRLPPSFLHPPTLTGVLQKMFARAAAKENVLA